MDLSTDRDAHMKGFTSRDLQLSSRSALQLAPDSLSKSVNRRVLAKGEQLQTRHKLVSGAELKFPTPAGTDVDGLVSQVALAATDLWERRGRQHKALHAFMGRAYHLAGRFRDNESEFGRIMRLRGIKRPKLDQLYYQVIQAFQPEDQRNDPDMKSEASRLKKALFQAETLGYTSEDFVRRIERKEAVAGRNVSGVNKLIILARLSKSARPRAETKLGSPAAVPDSNESSIDLSRYAATMLNKSLPLHERIAAMDAAADAAERAGISTDKILVSASSSEGPETTRTPAALSKKRELKRSGRKARPSGKARNKFDILSRPAKLLPWNHPALTEKRTIYPNAVVVPSDERVLIDGVNNAKTGPRILKGEWAGLPIFTLTLEERATCPTGCEHWRSCFGNNMHWGQRLQVGPPLEEAIRRDIAELTTQHPAGIAVRLHVLGDFYSLAYVELWADLLRKHTTLRVFGFSRRWDDDDPIAEALREIAQEQPQRWRIRLSNAPPELGPSTVSVEYAAPTGAIACPAQKHQTETCSTCALCWSTEKQIAFIQH